MSYLRINTTGSKSARLALEKCQILRQPTTTTTTTSSTSTRPFSWQSTSLQPSKQFFRGHSTMNGIARQSWNHQSNNYLYAPVVGYLTAWQYFGSNTTQMDSLAMIPEPQQEQQQIVESRKSLMLAPETNLSTWKQVRRKIRRAVRLIARVIKLLVALTPVFCLYPIQRMLQPSKKHQLDDEKLDAHLLALHDADEPATGALGWYLRVCLQCVEWSGAAVIKLMQWAGSRPDLFGHEFCSVFSQLQDNTTPHAWSHTEQVLREAYGDNWKERIVLNDILGSGCIGQVYHGVVKDKNGADQEVAVKVLHPNVHEDIDADLDIMRLAVRVLNRLPFRFIEQLKWLNFEGAVEEFAYMLKPQLDLRNEAANLEKFNRNFSKNKHVVFPHLVEGYQPTANVLIESFCDGIPVLAFAKQNKEKQEVLTKMCTHAIEAVCQMIFLDNFMHGDLHPGNVFVDSKHRFVLLDVGIVTEYTNLDHETIVDILACFIRKEGWKAGQLMIADSNRRLIASHDKAVDEDKYCEKIEALTIKASGKDYLMEHLGAYITYICDAAAMHHIMVNQAFISAALAVKIQEGIALALDPSIEIWRVATPIIVESERRRGKAGKRLLDVLGLDKLFRAGVQDEKVKKVK